MVYKISEAEETFYNNQGYDIYDDHGKLIKYSAKKTIMFSTHMDIVHKLEAEIEELKTQLQEKEDKKKSSGK